MKPCHPVRIALYTWVLCAALLSDSATRADEPPAPATRSAASQPVDEAEIEALIAQLSDPAYEKRTEATRRICAVGPAAIPALQRAARGDEYETALRARNLLRTFEQVFFSGLEIRLSVSKQEIDWDEPVDLTLSLVNRSTAPSRLSFEKPSRRESPSENPATARGVREVAELLDIGDFLTVTAPDGEEVDLRVDDISVNPFIAAVVHLRAEDGPVMTLAPGEKLEYRIAGFNRTWARYPLLEAGRYSIRFSYTPDWDDPVLRDANVGALQTEPVTIKVRSPAPEVVRARGSPVQIRVAREGDALVATLTNSNDLPQVMNMNFGHDDAPAAQVWWVIHVGEETFKMRSGPEARHAAIEAFSRDKLKELRPGQSIELDRIPMAVLESQPILAPLPAGAEFRVRVTYANRADLAWQMAQSNLIGNERAPEPLRRSLPDRLFSLQSSSDEILLTKSK